MGKYFTVDLIPDCIGGDVSDNNGTADIGAKDIIFDWTAINVPKGTHALTSVNMIVNAEDAAYAAGSLTDYELIFAKSINGEAPTSIGTIGGVVSGGFDLRDHMVGALTLESTAGIGTLIGLGFHVVYHVGSTSVYGNSAGPVVPIILDCEPSSGANVGYDTLYVAGIQISARNYGTGVLLNESDIDASTNPTSTIIVDGVDATKIFSVGDQVYVMDLDTPIPGTLTKVEPLLLTFSETNSTVDITEDDELLNANPIRIKLGFES